MSYGIVCEHEGCKAFARYRSTAPVVFYCGSHTPEGPLLIEIRPEEHERYMDNDTMRRMLAPRRAVATVGRSSGGLALMAAAMFGGQFGVDRRPLLAGREVEREPTARDRVAAEAISKAEAKRARKAAKLGGAK